MAFHFFAMLSRLKFIQRWSLMRNTQIETLSDHTVQVAFIAHSLAVIGNKRLGKSYDENKVAVLALYHDVTEILTGDMPTPIKYRNDTIKKAYKEVEKEAANRLVSMLPEDLSQQYRDILSPDPDSQETKEYYKLVKAADKISALIKCLEEKRAGNSEFKTAEKENLKQLKMLGCEEAEIFIFEFLKSFSCNLDELIAV